MLAKCNLDIKWFKLRFGILKKMPEFYKLVLIAWSKAGGGRSVEPSTFAQIRQQIIWGNKFITIKDKPLFFKHWINSNIIFIDDLLDDTNLLNHSAIYRKLACKTNWIIELSLILKAIPTRWIDLIKSPTSEKTKVKTYDHLSFGFMTKHILSSETKSCSLYKELVARETTTPYTQRIWQTLYKRVIIWDAVWAFLYRHLDENILKQFKFRLLHCIQPCGALAHRWKVAISPLCQKCAVVDDYQHMFVDCILVKPVWNFVLKSCIK